MTDEHSEYLAAFAIGAMVGVGATLLLSPRPSGAERILHELEPALERARKGSRRVRTEARAVAREFEKRGGRAFDAASSEIRRAARRRMRKARKAIRNRR